MSALLIREVEERLGALNGWTLEAPTDDQPASLVKEIKLESFTDAVDFVRQVAEIAEASQHYPDIGIYGRVVALNLMTEDEGGITDLDFDLAGKIDDLLS